MRGRSSSCSGAVGACAWPPLWHSSAATRASPSARRGLHLQRLRQTLRRTAAVAQLEHQLPAAGHVEQQAFGAVLAGRQRLDAGLVVHAVLVFRHRCVDAQCRRQRRGALRADHDVDREVAAHRHRVRQQAVGQLDLRCIDAPRLRAPLIAASPHRSGGQRQQQRQRHGQASADHCAGPAFHDEKSASALRQAMRSASGGGSSASQARDQFACSTT